MIAELDIKLAYPFFFEADQVKFILVLLYSDLSCFENTVGPDQLASDEAI